MNSVSLPATTTVVLALINPSPEPFLACSWLRPVVATSGEELSAAALSQLISCIRLSVSLMAIELHMRRRQESMKLKFVTS